MAQAKTNYDMTVHPTTALVRSQSNGAVAHAVTLPSCDCADFINRRGRLVEVEGGIAVTLCKHIEAALMRIGGWNRPAALEPAVYEDVTRERARTILAEARLPDTLVREALSTVTPGAPHFLPRPGSEAVTIRVKYAGGSQARRYTIVVPR